MPLLSRKRRLLRGAARLGAWCFAIGLCAPSVAVPARSLTLRVDPQATVLFDQNRQGCDASDHPDSPLRAFRNAEGEIVAFAPNFRNRAFTGARLSGLTRDCRVRFEAGESADPDRLDDRTWLQAFFTRDGKDVFALGSASFMPYRHGMRCRVAAARTGCWYNGIVALRSRDGGRTFSYLGTPPRHVVFRPPGEYRDDVESPAGFISTTNIVSSGAYAYALVWYRGRRPAESGNCLARAPRDTLAEWSLWDGRAFRPAARLEPDGWHGTAVPCAPVGHGMMRAARSLLLHEPTGTFIAIYQDRAPQAGGGAAPGTYYTTSRDLITWSPERLLLREALRADTGGQGAWSAYPTLIDPDSPDLNFGTIRGDRAQLVSVRIDPVEGGRFRVNRQLIMREVRVEE